MALSALITANGSSTLSGYNTTAGATLTLALISDVAPQGWELLCLATDGYNSIISINNSLTYNWSNYTVTFKVPNNICSIQFVSRVNYGRADQRTYIFGIYVLNDTGLRLQFGTPTNTDYNTFLASYNSFNITTPSVIYGSLSASSGNIDLTVANTFYIVPISTQGPSSNVAYTSNTINILSKGTVLVSGSLSLLGNVAAGTPVSGDQIALQLYENGSPVGNPSIVQVYAAHGTAFLTVQFLVTASAGQTFTLYVANKTNAATGLTIIAANLTVMSI